MAQSSNYKQFTRATRVLTEESGFAGGMLWTGNNIDETHLKAIVNCDYDDTTGYLKTRDPFVYSEDVPTEEDLAALGINLRNWSLLCVHNICAFDVTANGDDTTRSAGWLYVFAKNKNQHDVCEIDITPDNIVCIYSVAENYYKCDLVVDAPKEGKENEAGVRLRNINSSSILLNYENQLYGLGNIAELADTSTLKDAWLWIYRVEYHGTEVVNGKDRDVYKFKQLSYDEYVKPKINSVNLLEACNTGFNAARGANTFIYSSEVVEEQPHILGVYLTDGSPLPIVSPRAGQETVKVHVPVAYTTGTDKGYLVMFQLKEAGENTTSLDDSWTPVAVAESTDGNFVFNYTFQKKNTTLGFTYYGTTDPKTLVEDSEDIPAYSDKAVDYLMPYVITTGDNLSNLKVKNYNLSGVNGICLWRNRLCIWGTESSNNSLFLSDVDNFYYYPVPHNVALFDTNIINCIPYKDTLLVFTADKIYRVSENNDGSFTQNVVQNDMPLSKKDAAYLVAIKNMVLFKSGNYFYMIVPKSQSLTDELNIAPIYKNIAGFLNTLDNSVQEVLQLLYPEYLFKDCKVVNQAPTAVYAERDTVHLLYDVITEADIKVQGPDYEVVGRPRLDTIYPSFKLFLNYNTNLRAWTLYFEDTTNASLEVATLMTERKMSFVRIDSNGSFNIVTQQPVVVEDNNFRMLLDTGYRTLSTAVQKRFREVQLKLHSESENVAAFGTAFLVDGVWRRNYSKLQETLLENNTVSLTPTLDLNTFITELSMPIGETGDILKDSGSDSIELSDWKLDFSHFKREAPITIRIPVSGKGYSPRFIFMAPNATGITVNEINWVYRLMHGR